MRNPSTGAGAARRIFTAAAAASLAAGGLIVAGSSAAQAQSTSGNGFNNVSAPDSVTAGRSFKLKCEMSDKGWLRAKVQDKGVGVSATRDISGKNCSFNLTLNKKGSHEVRIKAIGGNNIVNSKWITIIVV